MSVGRSVCGEYLNTKYQICVFKDTEVGNGVGEHQYINSKYQIVVFKDTQVSNEKHEFVSYSDDKLCNGKDIVQIIQDILLEQA